MAETRNCGIEYCIAQTSDFPGAGVKGYIRVWLEAGLGADTQICGRIQ